MANKDNANPTILTQLPTRKSNKKRAGARDAIWGEEEDEDFRRLWGFAGWANLSDTESDEDCVPEPIDEQEVYDLICTIRDPEHPLSLGQLAVVNLPDIHIRPKPILESGPNELHTVLVEITPTITHCSMATVIGLGVRVRLERALPPNYRVDVAIKKGTHSQDDQVNKQLADKERVAAALENSSLKGMLATMLATCV